MPFLDSYDNVCETTFKVLRENRIILIFPLLVLLLSAVTFIIFISPALLAHPTYFTSIYNFESDFIQLCREYWPTKYSSLQEKIIFWSYCFAFYFCNFTIVVFFNSCIISYTTLYLENEKPSVIDAIQVTLQRLPKIILWSTISSTVGVLLKILEGVLNDKVKNDTNLIHIILVKFLGVSLRLFWTFGTYLVLPIIIIEDVNPFMACSISSSMCNNTFYDQMLRNFRLDVPFIIPAVIAIIGIIVSLVVSVYAFLILAPLLILYLTSKLLMRTASDTVYATVVYINRSET